MGRKKNVEGLTLDLTRIPENGEFIIENLIVVEKPAVPLVKRDKYNYSSEELSILNEKYSQPCTFCNKTGKMHFDHINMFNKSECVGIMIDKKYHFKDIIDEINKCQLLCIQCHKKVTAHEHKCGFIAKKRLFNKIIRSGGDVEGIKTVLIDQYNEIMGPFYSQMRASRGKLEDFDDPGVISLELPI
jgi:hypothetical protein